MTYTSPSVDLKPAVCWKRSPLRSFTRTLCFQVKSWLTANNPFPPLVGATISIFPSSRRVLFGLTSKNFFKWFTPMSKLVGSGLADVMEVSSSSRANRPLWSLLSNPQIRRCKIRSISVAMPIAPPAPSVSVSPATGRAPFFARALLVLQFDEGVENLALGVSPEQWQSHAHAGVVRDRYALPRPIAGVSENGLLSAA